MMVFADIVIVAALAFAEVIYGVAAFAQYPWQRDRPRLLEDRVPHIIVLVWNSIAIVLYIVARGTTL